MQTFSLTIWERSNFAKFFSSKKFLIEDGVNSFKLNCHIMSSLIEIFTLNFFILITKYVFIMYMASRFRDLMKHIHPSPTAWIYLWFYWLGRDYINFIFTRCYVCEKTKGLGLCWHFPKWYSNFLCIECFIFV